MTDLPSTLLVASLATPLAFLGACFVEGWRRHALALQWLAPVPSLATGLVGLIRAPLVCDLPATTRQIVSTGRAELIRF